MLPLIAMRGDAMQRDRGDRGTRLGVKWDQGKRTHGDRLETGEGHTHKGERWEDVDELSSVHPLIVICLGVRVSSIVRARWIDERVDGPVARVVMAIARVVKMMREKR